MSAKTLALLPTWMPKSQNRFGRSKDRPADAVAPWQRRRKRAFSRQRQKRIGRGKDLAMIGHAGEEIMKKLLVLMLGSWCGCAVAQTAQELIDNGKNPENITTFGMGYSLNQYSPLGQINTSNVKRLVPVWSTSLSNDTGELAQPTAHNG